MATLFSILAGKIPWAEEPGRLLSVGSESDTAEAAEHACTTVLHGTQLTHFCGTEAEVSFSITSSC